MLSELVRDTNPFAQMRGQPGYHNSLSTRSREVTYKRLTIGTVMYRFFLLTEEIVIREGRPASIEERTCVDTMGKETALDQTNEGRWAAH